MLGLFHEQPTEIDVWFFKVRHKESESRKIWVVEEDDWCKKIEA